MYKIVIANNDTLSVLNQRSELNLTKYFENSLSKSCCLNVRYIGFIRARFAAITDDRLCVCGADNCFWYPFITFGFFCVSSSLIFVSDQVARSAASPSAGAIGWSSRLNSDYLV